MKESEKIYNNGCYLRKNEETTFCNKFGRRFNVTVKGL